MIKSDRFSTDGLLPDPPMDSPDARSLDDLKRAKYDKTDPHDLQNGNAHPGSLGQDLIDGRLEGDYDGFTDYTYMSRIDSLSNRS